MNEPDTREWLLTNGLGSFASGTISDAHTRTYHGWLFAAIDPPSDRRLLLSRIDATLETSGQQFELGTNFWQGGTIAPTGYELLRSFSDQPTPTWNWSAEQWQCTRELILPYGFEADRNWCNRVLIRYTYQGTNSATLNLRLLIADRNFHYQQQSDPDLHFSQLIDPHRLLLQAQRSNWIGTPWQLCWTQGAYHADGLWYRNYCYLEETRRGLGDREDLYSPGCLVVVLRPGDTVTLEARVRHPNPAQPYDHLTDETFDRALQQEQQRLDQQFAALAPAVESKEKLHLWQQLLKAGDRFIVHRASISGPTVIAGYPWFNDWGRDTLIALPGLTLTTKRFDIARGLLATFAQYCQHGLIPNAFPDAGAKPYYNSIDATLWWIETLGLYLEASQDWEFLVEQYPIARRIYKGFVAGTLHDIRVDAFDGLVTWSAPGVALTWMDAVLDGQPVTPRRGKAIEINALWYSALCWLVKWAERSQDSTIASHATRYRQQAEQVKDSLQKFWNPERHYFYDAIAPTDHPDPAIRPNAVIALSLHHCGFSEYQAKRVLQVARDRLLTPYGLRSLDSADPQYVGSYAGDVQHRDRAYHQGTVWSWLIGSFIRAWQRFYLDDPLPFDASLLIEHFQNQACLNSVSEIFDGDAPHHPQGAIAQAWSIAELTRHWADLTNQE